jgi:hypothetical protein
MPQRHKGERLLLSVRTPVEVGEQIRRQAAESGLPVSEYVTAILAREVGRPELAPRPRPSTDSLELPINAA